jgi:hypothetical protein
MFLEPDALPSRYNIRSRQKTGARDGRRASPKEVGGEVEDLTAAEAEAAYGEYFVDTTTGD